MELNQIEEIWHRLPKITIIDELSSTSRDMKSHGMFPYVSLLEFVSREFGLYGDGFQLTRLRDHRLYPRCLDYMYKFLNETMEEMDIVTNDVFIIQHFGRKEQEKSEDQSKCLSEHSKEIILYVNSKVHMTDNATQTDDGMTAGDLIYVRADFYGTFYDLYVRSDDRIVDLSLEFLRHNDDGYCFPVQVKWEIQGTLLLGDDTTTLAMKGIVDGSLIQCLRTFIIGAGIEEARRIKFTSTSIGVQTVAKPGNFYFQVQPPPPPPPPPPPSPPPVDDPPPAKT